VRPFRVSAWERRPPELLASALGAGPRRARQPSPASVHAKAPQRRTAIACLKAVPKRPIIGTIVSGSIGPFHGKVAFEARCAMFR
jgi:hypothetical protein